MNRKRRLAKREQRIILEASGIDRLSILLAEALTEAGTEQKDVTRLRLAVEDILTLWHGALGEHVQCIFRCGSRLGRMYIEIRAFGERLDPSEATEEIGDGLLYSTLLAQAGLSPVYSYRDGQNCLTLYPPKPQRMNPLISLVLSMAAAFLCGLLCLALPHPVQTAAVAVSEPLFNALMGILQALAGPVIFLSVCWGIVCIGDVQVLGRIGRTVIFRFIAGIYVTTGLSALCLVWLFQGGTTSVQGENAASQIYSMLLGIIPNNILSPFLEGNSLQIIFMAVCMGLVMLFLKEKLPTLYTLVEQGNTAVQFMMETVSRYIPVFTFISLFTLILSNRMSGLGRVAKGLLLAAAACLIWPLIYALAAALRLKVSYPLLLRKLLPTYLIALTTASSSAALSTNLETCEEKLGISEHISRFAVPLGQVIFKTGGGVGFFVLAMGLAEYYGVSISLPWVITGVLTSGLLAIAAPPVPGGSLTCYTVLLAQLGIPAQAVALAIAGNVILDFFMTSCGISCLQSELILAANRLGLLNKNRLKERESI